MEEGIDSSSMFASQQGNLTQVSGQNSGAVPAGPQSDLDAADPGSWEDERRLQVRAELEQNDNHNACPLEATEDLDFVELARQGNTDDVKISAAFIRGLQTASLDDPVAGLDADTLHRLRNPIQETLKIDDPDFRNHMDFV
jgi:hypothetical protein